MTTTKIKTEKVDKKSNALLQGKVISSNALTLFNQALSELETSTDILSDHAEDAETQADQILFQAQAQATMLRQEAAEARKGVEYNIAVHDKISSLLSV